MEKRVVGRLSRNLGLDLVRGTEAAALVAGRWMGLDEPGKAAIEAMEAMRAAFGTVDVDGRAVIGVEGRADECSALETGQSFGTGSGRSIDLVLDPIDGLDLLAKGHPGAISAIAGAPRDAFWSPSPAVYMEKVVVDAQVAEHLVPECLVAPAGWTLALVARVKGKKIRDLTVFVLDRPRHVDLIDEIRRAGARVMLRTAGDVAGALLATMLDSSVDILMGVGGIPEGLISACAVKAMNGAMLGRLAPQSSEERAAVEAVGLDIQQILTLDELVSGDNVFFAATGITDGPLLEGVKYHGARACSNSMILQGETKTRRTIFTEHLLGNSGLPRDD
jgi:fructose-1,6-bisphosphatase II